MVDVWEDRQRRVVEDIPVGAFLPFDWATYEFLRVAWAEQRSAEEAERDAAEYRREQEEASAKRLAAQQAEADYRFDQDSKYLKRLVDNMSSSEYEAMGQPVEHERKPFTYVKGVI